MRCFLAIDIGASSGRHIVGWRENGEIRTDEIYRFPNGVKQMGGHLIWDMEQLPEDVKAGITAAKAKYPRIESLSISQETNMKAAFDAAANGGLRTMGDYFRCAYRSLAESYRVALEELERNTGKKYSRLYIVGGGAKNQFLNRLTREATGKQVIALPIEATALGNLRIQMEADQT